MTLHPVPRPDGEPLDMPVADQRPQARGSVNSPCARNVSTNRLSWVVVATYAQNTPPGTRAAATASTHSQGASMSSTTRSTSVSSKLDQVADLEPPGRVLGAEEAGDVLAGDLGEVLAALERDHLAVNLADRP